MLHMHERGFYDFVKLLVHFALFQNFQLFFFFMRQKEKQRTKAKALTYDF